MPNVMASVMSYNEQQQAVLEGVCHENPASRSDFLTDEYEMNTNNGNDQMLISKVECVWDEKNQDICGVQKLYSNLKFSLWPLTTNSGQFLVPRSGYLSEENEGNIVNRVQCDDDYFVTRIACYGGKCDNKRLQCRKLKNTAGIRALNHVTHDTGWAWPSSQLSLRSEVCPTDYYMIGMQCRNGRCGNIKLTCRRIEVCI